MLVTNQKKKSPDTTLENIMVDPSTALLGDTNGLSLKSYFIIFICVYAHLFVPVIQIAKFEILKSLKSVTAE